MFNYIGGLTAVWVVINKEQKKGKINKDLLAYLIYWLCFCLGFTIVLFIYQIICIYQN
jgi:hypothetical protein